MSKRMDDHVKPSKFWKTGSFVSCLMLTLALALALPGCAVQRDTDGPGTVADSRNGHEPIPVYDEPVVAETDATASDAEIVEMIASLGFTETDMTEILDEEMPAATEVAEDPAVLVAEALEACEYAREYWEQGEIEEALNSLDHAYELLLEIP